MNRYHQSKLDAAIAAGDPQVLELEGRNFLVLGKLDRETDAYVGYEIEKTERGTPELLPLDHRVRLFDYISRSVHPLRATLEVPYRMAPGTIMPLFETVLEVIKVAWLRGPSHSDEELQRVTRQAAESVVVSGLWSDATLMMELWDQSVRRLGDRTVEDLGLRPFNRHDLEALTKLMADIVRMRHTPPPSG